MLRDAGKKKNQIDALDRFDQQFQNIRKEKQTFVSKHFQGLFTKKNPRTYHSILPLIAQCGAYDFNFNFI